MLLDTDIMPAQPVQISIDRDLLRQLDADPEVKARGRSAVVRDAVASYLRGRRRARIDEEIRAAYRGQADRMLREVNDLLGGQSWPEE
jgi:metal-responsive CopG/Arc/MetJ family transcriptional regulator